MKNKNHIIGLVNSRSDLASRSIRFQGAEATSIFYSNRTNSEVMLLAFTQTARIGKTGDFPQTCEPITLKMTGKGHARGGRKQCFFTPDHGD